MDRGYIRCGTDACPGHVDIPPDAYGVIRSDSIREYLQKEDSLDIFEKEQLILHSYTPVWQKTALLEQLALSGSGKERSAVEEMCRVYTEATGMIRTPPDRTLFILEVISMEWEVWYLRCEPVMSRAFDSVRETEEAMEQMARGYKTAPFFGRVTAVQNPLDEKARDLFRADIFMIDGRWQFRDISLDEGQLERYAASQDILKRMRDISRRHTLPFEDGCRLRLQMPFMQDPVYGVLKKQRSRDGELEQYLEVGPGEWVDLSYQEIQPCSGYSTLDWIERA